MSVRSKQPSFSHTWRDFSENELKEILACETATAMKKTIARICGLEQNTNYSNLQKDILVDFFYNNIVFAKKNRMEGDKVSTFFSIMKDIHEISMQTEITLVESFSMFKGMLVKHCVHRPPFSLELFSLEEVKQISNYICQTYYRHYKLYQYTFCKKKIANLETLSADDRTEKPFPVKPLQEAIPEEQLLQK